MTDIDYSDARAQLSAIDPFGFADVMQAIGATLWRVQLLEESVATYLVLKLGLDGAVARDAAEAVLEKVKKRTLGQIVREVNEKASVPDAVSDRLLAFVELRNWLVHRSQSECGVLLRTEDGRRKLEERLAVISTEGLAIQELLASELETILLARGVKREALLEHLAREVRRRTGA